MPLVAAAAIGAAGSIYSASQASSASSKALKAQEAASAEQRALQQQQLDRTTAANAPFTNAGYSALDALLSQLGLTTPQAAQPQQDWDGYLAKYSDVAAQAQKGVQAGAIGPNGQWKTPEEWAAFHYQNSGQAEGRTVPMTTPAPLPAAHTAPAPPTNFSLIGQPGEAPGFGGGYDAYAESAEFKDKVAQSARLTNSGYAAKGLLRSGGAIRAVQDRATDLAEADYQEWFDRALKKGYFDLDRYRATSNQYNADRTSAFSQYNTDRNFTTDNLFKLTGIGQNSANNTATSGSNFAANTGNIAQNQANATAENATNQAAANSQMFNSVANLGANYFNSTAGMSREAPKAIDPYGYGTNNYQLAPVQTNVPGLNTNIPNFYRSAVG